jgi:hypothetical protein
VISRRPDGSFDDAGPLGFVQRSDQGVTLDARHVFEQIRLEVPPDHRGGFQYVLRLRGHPLQPAFEYDAHGVGELDLVEIELARPLLIGVEQPSFVLQMTKQLGDKKRVSTGVVGESVYEPGWRMRRAEGGQHAGNLGAIEWP